MKDMKNLVVSSLCVSLLASTLMTGCESSAVGTGAAIGGATGLGIGALAGNSTSATIGGAAIGAAAGALVGLAVDSNRQTSRNYPVATPTNRWGFVRSPYTNQLIDVRGMGSGTLVRDPSTRNGDVFIVP